METETTTKRCLNCKREYQPDMFDNGHCWECKRKLFSICKHCEEIYRNSEMENGYCKTCWTFIEEI